MPASRQRAAVLVGTTSADDVLVERVRTALSADLLRGKWRKLAISGHPMTGHCYVATEALYHLLGGREGGWQPRMLSFDNDRDWGPGGESHWWLENADGRRIAATADQFATPVPYERGRHKAFVTNARLGANPSGRAQTLIDRVPGR